MCTGSSLPWCLWLQHMSVHSWCSVLAKIYTITMNGNFISYNTLTIINSLYLPFSYTVKINICAPKNLKHCMKRSNVHGASCDTWSCWDLIINMMEISLRTAAMVIMIWNIEHLMFSMRFEHMISRMYWSTSQSMTSQLTEDSRLHIINFHERFCVYAQDTVTSWRCNMNVDIRR